jgi:hypothetical protein
VTAASGPSPDAPPPGWLPAAIPFAGDWSVFVAVIYTVFCRDFKGTWPRFRAWPVWHDRRVLPDGDGKEEGFWHLVSRDQWVYNRQTRRNEKERLPELDRAGRLPWARPLVEHETDAAVQAWDFDEVTNRGPAVRTYIWLKAHDYVIILERQKRERGDIFQLITSFLVDHEGKRRDLESRHARRRKQ